MRRQQSCHPYGGRPDTSPWAPKFCPIHLKTGVQACGIPLPLGDPSQRRPLMTRATDLCRGPRLTTLSTRFPMLELLSDTVNTSLPYGCLWPSYSRLGLQFSHQRQAVVHPFYTMFAGCPHYASPLSQMRFPGALSRADVPPLPLAPGNADTPPRQRASPASALLHSWSCTPVICFGFWASF